VPRRSTLELDRLGEGRGGRGRGFDHAAPRCGGNGNGGLVPLLKVRRGAVAAGAQYLRVPRSLIDRQISGPQVGESAGQVVAEVVEVFCQP
jgi:hypothetical protein